jgi:hypothetical protein
MTFFTNIQPSSVALMSDSKLKQTRIRFTGTRPLIVCRGEAANPFDPQAQAIKSISQKKNKTLEDHEKLARLQFESSLYYDPKIGPYIPVENILAAIVLGANRYKEGTLVKSQLIIRGFVDKELDSAAAKLIYSGPRDVEGLYADKRFVFMKMGKPQRGSRILVTRALLTLYRNCGYSMPLAPTGAGPRRPLSCNKIWLGPVPPAPFFCTGLFCCRKTSRLKPTVGTTASSGIPIS